MSSVSPRVPMSKHRLDAFSDGVFAISATLLVLNLHIPELVKHASATDLLHALFEQWPRLVSFAVSFSIIAVYWIGHHIVLHYVRHVDRMFLNYNNLYLLIVAFMPFPTALIGQYGDNLTAELVYGTTLVIGSLVLSLLWVYATTNHRLVDPDLNDRLVRKATTLILAGPLVYVPAMALAFVRPHISLFVYFLVPVFYIIGGPIDNIMAMDDRPKHP